MKGGVRYHGDDEDLGSDDFAVLVDDYHIVLCHHVSLDDFSLSNDGVRGYEPEEQRTKDMETHLVNCFN
jgi:hypothetical protein